jgi:transcription antitermination factor NusG
MVYSIVGNKVGALPLPDDEIETLRRGLTPGDVMPHPYLKVGQRARIRTGPLAGLVGIVKRMDGGLRVVLAVDLIMRSISVQVDGENLEFLGEADKTPASASAERTSSR